MKILMQRVNRCKLTSEDYVSEIGFGLLITVGINKLDTELDVDKMANKIVNLRQFKDEAGKTNLSIKDICGDIMLVSNFTLQADTTRGTRPDFSKAGNPDNALKLYLLLAEKIRNLGIKCELGNFGHHMHIDCELDGPFGLILE